MASVSLSIISFDRALRAATRSSVAFSSNRRIWVAHSTTSPLPPIASVSAGCARSAAPPGKRLARRARLTAISASQARRRLSSVDRSMNGNLTARLTLYASGPARNTIAAAVSTRATGSLNPCVRGSARKRKTASCESAGSSERRMSSCVVRRQCASRIDGKAAFARLSLAKRDAARGGSVKRSASGLARAPSDDLQIARMTMSAIPVRRSAGGGRSV